MKPGNEHQPRKAQAPLAVPSTVPLRNRAWLGRGVDCGETPGRSTCRDARYSTRHRTSSRRPADERRAAARAAVAQERARLARELHDVLAHSVGAMVVNAEGARLMRHADPAVVDRTLDLVSSTGRAALEELRRLLAVLDDADPAVDDLRDLVTRCGARLATNGTGDGLPGEALPQAYRIVQEALTNVMKHGGDGATADVFLDFGRPGARRTVNLTVRNTAGQGDPPGLPSSGRGLAGIRQRAAAFGGTVEAGPTADGGFRVAVTLPIGGTAFRLPARG